MIILCTIRMHVCVCTSIYISLSLYIYIYIHMYLIIADTSQVMRVILAQGPCQSSPRRSNFNRLSPKGIHSGQFDNVHLI